MTTSEHQFNVTHTARESIVKHVLASPTGKPKSSVLGFEQPASGWAPSAEFRVGAGMTHDGGSDGIQWRWNKGAMQMDDEAISICVVSVLSASYVGALERRVGYLRSVAYWVRKVSIDIKATTQYSFLECPVPHHAHMLDRIRSSYM
jgi:hypothetical protein